MPSFSTSVRIIAETLPTRAWAHTRARASSEMVTIEFGPGQLIAFAGGVNAAQTEAEAKLTEPGLVFNRARIAQDGMKLPKRDGGERTVIASIGSGSVKFQDTGRELSLLINNKLANLEGTRGRTLRAYRWPAGSEPDFDADLVGTFRIGDRDWEDGYRTLQLTDIRRQLQTRILVPQEYRLATSIDADTTAFDMHVTDGIQWRPPMVQHDRQLYPYDRGDRIMYVETPTGETIGVRETEHIAGTLWRCRELRRNALGGPPAADVLVPVEAEQDNLPKLREYIYAIATIPQMLEYLICGRFLAPGAVINAEWPAHWAAQTLQKWIHRASFTYAIPDMAAVPLRIQDYGSTTAKDLIEKEILPLLPGSLQVDVHGRMLLRRITNASASGGDVYRYDASSIDPLSVSKIESRNAHIQTTVGVRHGWNPRTKEFRSISKMDSPLARAAHADGESEAKITESKLLHDSIVTMQQVQRMLPGMLDFYAGETLHIGFDVQPGAPVVGIGSRVGVRIDWAPDDTAFSGLAPSIDRSMVVASVDPDIDGGGTRMRCYATSGRFFEDPDVVRGPQLLDEEYTRGGTDLSTIIPFTLVQGIWRAQAGNYQLDFTKKYFFDRGPVSFSAGVRITGSVPGPYLQLWIPDPVQMSGTGIFVTIGMGTTEGGAPGQPGGTGFAVPTVGAGSLVATAKATSGNSDGDRMTSAYAVRSLPGVRAADYTDGDIPQIALRNNDGALAGLPGDLSGYAGCGGGSARIRYANRSGGGSSTVSGNGSAGVRGSAGILLVCRGLVFLDESSKPFVTSGLPGVEGQEVATQTGVAPPGATFYSGAGGGAGPGSVVFINDGDEVIPDIAAHTSAEFGLTPVLGQRSPRPFVERAPAIGRLSSHFVATFGAGNVARACCRALRVPSRGRVEEALDGDVFERFFQLQRDGVLELIESDVQPSNGNIADFWIRPADRFTNTATPAIEVLFPTGWRAWKWGDRFSHVYAALIEIWRRTGGSRLISSPTRPATFSDGDGWHNPLTDTVVILRDSGADELIYAGETQLGDNRWPDPRFARWRRGEPTWYVGTRIRDLPMFGRTEYEPTPESFPLNPPGLTVVIESGSRAELTITPPSVATGVVGYELRRSGAVIAQVAFDDLEFTDATVIRGSSYVYQARSIGDGLGEIRSADVSVEVTIPDDGSTPTDGTPVVTFGFPIGEYRDYNGTVGSTGGGSSSSGGASDLQVTDRQGPQIEGIASGSQYAGRKVRITTANNSPITESSNVRSGGGWTAAIPSSYGSQQMQAYVNNAAGTAYELIAFAYQSADGSTGGGGNDLEPITNARGEVYSSTAVELFWSSPTDRTVASELEVRRNGSLVKTFTKADKNSFFVNSGLSPNTTYTWTIRHVRGGDRSADVTITTKTRR